MRMAPHALGPWGTTAAPTAETLAEGGTSLGRRETPRAGPLPAAARPSLSPRRTAACLRTRHTEALGPAFCTSLSTPAFHAYHGDLRAPFCADAVSEQSGTPALSAV
ncbi:hypothetical protein CapIbe_004183 [Capra ibex]